MSVVIVGTLAMPTGNENNPAWNVAVAMRLLSKPQIIIRSSTW